MSKRVLRVALMAVLLLLSGLSFPQESENHGGRPQTSDPRARTVFTRVDITDALNAPRYTDCANMSGASKGDLCYDVTAGRLEVYDGSAWAALGSGGGGGSVTAKEGGVVVSSAVSVLDFLAGFDLTESPAGEVNISLDYAEDPVNLGSADVTGTLPDANVSDALTIGSASSVTLAQSVAPTPTAEGRIEWDTDDDRIVVGTGAASATFYSGAHTTDTTCLDSAVSCQFAGSSTEGGPATTALALDSDPANCPAGQYPLGIGADGAVQGCTADSTGTDTLDDLSDNVLADLSNVSSTAPTTGQVLEWNGTAWAPGTDDTSSGGSTPSGPAGAVQLSNGSGSLVHDQDGDGTTDISLPSGSGSVVIESVGGVMELASTDGSRIAFDPGANTLSTIPSMEVWEQVAPNSGTGAGQTALHATAKKITIWADPYDYENLADPFNYGGAAFVLEDKLNGSAYLYSPSNQTISIELGADTDIDGDSTPDRWDAINAAIARFVSELSVDSLASCDTIDTNASGVFSCGVDDTGTDTLDDLSDNVLSDLSDVSTTAPSSSQVLKWNGTAWAPAADDDVPESGDFGAAADLDSTGALLADSVTSAEIAAGAVQSVEILDGAVATADIADDAITAAKLATDVVGTAHLNDGTDTPVDGECVKVAGGGTRFEYASCGTGGGSSSMILASWTLLDPSSGTDALNLDAGGDTYLGPAMDAAATVTKVVCVVDLGQSGESCTVDILEVTSAGAATTVEANVAASNTGGTSTAIDDSAIAAGNWLALDIDSCTGTISQLSCVVWGTVP